MGLATCHLILVGNKNVNNIYDDYDIFVNDINSVELVSLKDGQILTNLSLPRTSLHYASNIAPFIIFRKKLNFKTVHRLRGSRYNHCFQLHSVKSITDFMLGFHQKSTEETESQSD